MSDAPTTDILDALRDPRNAGHLNAAAANEIERLHVVVRAARDELEHGGGGEAEAYLILKHSGVS